MKTGSSAKAAEIDRKKTHIRMLFKNDDSHSDYLFRLYVDKKNLLDFRRSFEVQLEPDNKLMDS
ncbi:hypothetical protein [Endozoicomonas sp. ALC020]|uniref:hypothetical protein n=1 Tax=unclassified Endozoicomonas TaxID=2644528 RepID=UPI003BB1BC3A